MDDFTEKIGILLTCEPKFCIKENCLLPDDEVLPEGEIMPE